MKLTFKQFVNADEDQITEIFGFLKKETPAEILAKRKNARKISPETRKKIDQALADFKAGKRNALGAISDEDLDSVLSPGDRAALARHDREVSKNSKW